MKCPKCGSENVNAQAVTETKLVTKRKGAFYWIFIGWWWLPFKWVCLTIPAIIIKLFRPARYKTKVKHMSKFVCQDCGYLWSTGH